MAKSSFLNLFTSSFESKYNFLGVVEKLLSSIRPKLLHAVYIPAVIKNPVLIECGHTKMALP